MKRIVRPVIPDTLTREEYYVMLNDLRPNRLTWKEAKPILLVHPYMRHNDQAKKIALTLLWTYSKGGNVWLPANWLNRIAKDAVAQAEILQTQQVKGEVKVRCRLLRETAAYLERRKQAVGVPVESNCIYQEPTRDPINEFTERSTF